MISIRKSAEELDRLEEVVRLQGEVYRHAILSTSQYAIEVDPSDVGTFRSNLDRLEKLARVAKTRDEWEMVQASLRGELRDYRDLSSGRIARLREEIVAAAHAMQTFADSVAANGADHVESLQESLGRLDGVAKSNDLATIKGIVADARQAIAASVEQIRSHHQIVVAQLRDELRLLHEQIEAERKAVYVDRATGVWNAGKLQARIDELIDAGESFCVIVVCVRNLKRVEHTYAPSLAQMGLRALLRRFAGMLEDNVPLGRMNESSFAAILHVDSGEAIRVSRDASRRLTGTYAVQEEGLSHNVALRVATGVVDHGAGGDRAAFAQKLAQLSEALAGA